MDRPPPLAERARGRTVRLSRGKKHGGLFMDGPGARLFNTRTPAGHFSGGEIPRRGDRGMIFAAEPPDGCIAYIVKTPRRGGTHRVMTPVEFLGRLAIRAAPEGAR
jgi:hypothetical protein